MTDAQRFSSRRRCFSTHSSRRTRAETWASRTRAAALFGCLRAGIALQCSFAGPGADGGAVNSSARARAGLGRGGLRVAARRRRKQHHQQRHSARRRACRARARLRRRLQPRRRRAARRDAGLQRRGRLPARLPRRPGALPAGRAGRAGPARLPRQLLRAGRVGPQRRVLRERGGARLPRHLLRRGRRDQVPRRLVAARARRRRVASVGPERVLRRAPNRLHRHLRPVHRVRRPGGHHERVRGAAAHALARRALRVAQLPRR